MPGLHLDINCKVKAMKLGERFVRLPLRSRVSMMSCYTGCSSNLDPTMTLKGQDHASGTCTNIAEEGAQNIIPNPRMTQRIIVLLL